MLARIGVLPALFAAPLMGVRLDHGSMVAVQEHASQAFPVGHLAQLGLHATAHMSSQAIAGPSLVPALAPGAPSLSGVWQDTKLHSSVVAEEEGIDSFALYDAQESWTANLKRSKVTLFEGAVGQTPVRFGVTRNPILGRSVLFAEQLILEDGVASWRTLNVQFFERVKNPSTLPSMPPKTGSVAKRSASSSRNATWDVNDVVVAKELLGRWEPPLSPMAGPLLALELVTQKWQPRWFEFKMINGKFVVSSDMGVRPVPLEPAGTTFEGYVNDRLHRIRSRFFLSKAAGRLIGELQSTSTANGEEWSPAFFLAQRADLKEADLKRIENARVKAREAWIRGTFGDEEY